MRRFKAFLRVESLETLVPTITANLFDADRLGAYRIEKLADLMVFPALKTF